MNLQTAINLKNASTLWHFYCSPINVFVLWLSGYVESVGVTVKISSNAHMGTPTPTHPIPWSSRHGPPFPCTTAVETSQPSPLLVTSGDYHWSPGQRYL